MSQTKYKYDVTDADYRVRGMKAFFGFLAAASALVGVGAKGAQALCAAPALNDVVQSSMWAVAIPGVVYGICVLRQAYLLRGNGHGPARRVMNCLFNPASYKGGMAPR